MYFLPPDLHSLKKRVPFILAVTFLIFAAVVALDLNPWSSEAASQTTQVSAKPKKQTPNFVPGQVLIRFKDSSAISKSTSAPGVRRALSLAVPRKEIDLQIERLDSGREIVGGLRIAHVNPEDTQLAIAALNSRPDVLYAEPNYLRVKQVAPNDPRYVDMWNLKNTSGVGFGVAGADIKAEQAWEITRGSRNVVVAVIDEGIDVNHPDLQPNVWTNPAEIPGNGIDDDSNGFIDDINGFDFLHNDGTVYDGPGTNPDGSPIDAHGTHVAGTLGATGNNGIGVAGVNWEVSLMSLKFLGPQGGTTADAIKAFSYVKMMRELWISSNGTKGANVRITNNSYGNLGFSQSELDAIQSLNAAGILFVAAAGNDSLNNNQIGEYPASYDSPNIISVASTDRFDRLSLFSNYGWGNVHIGAPGTGILSTVPGNNYAVNQGTSMASPHVAGTAALVLAQHPEFTLNRLRASVIFGGTEIASMIGVVETGNRLDAAAALQNANDNDSTEPGPINDLQVISTVGRAVTLRWTSPGDDGFSGRAVLNEMRFTDQSSGRRYIVGTAKPAPAGVQQVATVNIPYLHTDGSLELRVIDNAGNVSAANTNVQIDPQAASPYEITESPAEPLSTGGTKVDSNFDDFITDFSLPFVFPYFESNIESIFAQGPTSSVFYSTNGTLYFARSAHPGEDAFSASIFLPAWRMIAGMWDDLDLRTSARSDAGVFVVTPDSNRIIFRWQGVPCNTSFTTGLCQGGPPINFEIELRSDGTIIKRYGSGNTELAPVVGISAGEFDPYVIASHTASDSNISLENAPTVTYRLRNLPKKADIGFTSSSVSPDIVLVGTDTNIKLTISNLGPDQAAGARVVGSLPLNLSVQSCTSSAGTCWVSPGPSDIKVFAALGTVQPNTPVTIDVVVRLVSATDTNRLFPIATSWSASSFTFDPVSNGNLRSVNFGGLNPNPNPLTNSLTVGAGTEHALAIVPGGNLLSWGQNFASQLGTDGITRRTRPGAVEGITNVLQVDGGNGHSIALTIDGRVWAWGANDAGQLGDGTTNLRKTPLPISGLSGVTEISGGGAHNLALLNNGTAWAWGLNGSGRLGDGTTTTRMSPVQVTGLTNVIAISAGNNHSLAVKSDGTVWAWGDNESGKLGDGTEVSRSTPVQVVGLSNITAVSAGGTNSFALDNNGRVWSWGQNFSGQVGDGTTTKRVTPVQIPTLTNVVRIAAGTSHCLALLGDGTVWSWGSNFRGALGQSLLAEFQSTPGRVLWISNITALAAGNNLSFARRADGKLFAWGEGGWGQLGDENEISRGFPYEVSAPPAPPQGPPPIGTLIAPTFSPDGGSFGSTQTVTIRSASADAVLSKAAFGWNHSLFLMSDGTVWGAGANFFGHLGDGTTTSSNVLVQTRISDVLEVSAGASHSLALKTDGTVWSWGFNSQGQLGIGSAQQESKTSPVKVESLSGVVSVSASGDFSLALKADGTVWTWGWNDQGQLGNNTQINSNVPIQVQGLSGVTFATTGVKHSLALKSDGTVWTWGSNQSLQLGDGTTVSRRLTPVQVVGLTNVTTTSTSGETCLAVRNDGSVWMWGANSEGQLALGQTGPHQSSPVQVDSLSTASTFSMGAYHGLARFGDGSVRAWGANFAGQVGNGGTTTQPSPVQVATNSISITAKNNASSIIKSDGFWVWGQNNAGQLGVGSTGDKLSPVKLNPVVTGVTIHYTTNGLDPTEADTVIVSGSTIAINQTTTLKARAFKTGWTPSPVKTATFTIAGAPEIQFGQPSYAVNESGANFNVSVGRIGDLSNAASVNYSTSDTAGANNCDVGGGQASSRCDYLTSIGKLTFAPGEATKSILIPVVDDAYFEGPENFNITLSNVVGASLGAQSSATLTINDNDSVTGVNPIDVAGFYVRQQYIDFLNREPDPGGLAFWTNEITSCGLDTKCIEVKRVNVSAAFFLSIEFQETGYFVYRVSKTGFGNLTTPAGALVPVRFLDFLRDTQEVGKDVIVGVGDWQSKLEANKQAYMLAFVQQPDFQTEFPNSINADQFVSKLDNNAGGVLSPTAKSNLISQLNANPNSESLRAQVLRSVAENQNLKDAETNRAFVLMQYFGYLRRNPFDPPNADFSGYNFWLGKLDHFNGNFVDAEMVKAFIQSLEYRQRFGP